VPVFLRLLATALVVPPANLPLLAILGFLIHWRRPRLGRAIIVLAILLLLLLSLHIVSGTLLAALETDLPLQPPADAPPQAIVILSAGSEDWASDPEFGVDPLTLQRMQAGATLYRRTHLPILVTGGVLRPGEPPIAVLMAHSLPDDFQVPVRWIEPASADTWQNASLSAAILRDAGIRSVWLVTHAWHERRAVLAFARFGIVATAAPVGLDRMPDFRPSGFYPRTSAWQAAYYALHEWIGCAYYALR
jgi:uncharacterized SAM-binding protein YcdF (DUF218 family)